VPGGIGTYVRGLVGAIDPHHADVTLWASRAPARGPDPVAALGRPVLTSPLPSRAMVWAWDRGWAPSPDRFDVVHATSFALPPAGGSPLTATVHDLAWRRVPEAFPRRGRRWHEAALGRALARATAFIVPSRQTADDLLAAGAPASRVEVVEEGCDHLVPPDAAGAAAFRSALGVGGDYLLAVSTLEPRKNLPRLLAAYQAARPRLPGKCPLLVVGPVGWGKALSPQEGVLLGGPVEGALLAGLYAEARLVASVPLVEGFGLPAVEAMACGAPVMASPLPSAGGAAYDVDPLDVEGMAIAMARIATDDGLRADLVAAGRARAAGLTWARAAAAHVDIWTSLSSSTGVPYPGP
jgi:glycosyltransferase involved in cell wall biosynthesis